MHINEIFKHCPVTFSFEFFPPRTPEAAATLRRSIEDLVPLQPSYVSVTYGAGGSTRQLTHDLVVSLQQETCLNVVSHLTTVGSDRQEIHAILETYAASGIENIMALRGDPPKGTAFAANPNGFNNATELVAYIKKHFPKLGVGVAAYPEGHPATPNRLKEMDYLKAKVDAGADYICTQLFFDNYYFYDFRERCLLAGIQIPILAGIMPVTSIKSMQRMAELSGGTAFPAKLQRAIARAEDDACAERVGTHWATHQVLDLLDNNVRGVHFYTLNKSRATRQIYEWLGVSNSQGLNR
ncbi:MAG: methylenetetrahydrofolate reductase [NAD(P)H] [Chloroflexota bacterium]